MDSPKTTKRVNVITANTPNRNRQKQNCTPNTPKRSLIDNDTPKRRNNVGRSDIISLGSPKLWSPRETRDEVGWDESPEPLKVDTKPKTLFREYKHLEDFRTKQKSSLPPPLPVLQAPTDLESELVKLQNVSSRLLAISKHAGRETSSDETSASTDIADDDELTSEALIACTQLAERNIHSDKGSLIKCHKPNSTILKFESKENQRISNTKKPLDYSFEKVLQSFCDEGDDEWLSQAVLEPRPAVAKALFCKAKSSMQLESPSRSGLRRTSSFGLTETKKEEQSNSVLSTEQPLKKQKSFHLEPDNLSSQLTSTQCTTAEIERKRLEAKFRKDQLEIERKRQEALRRLRGKKRIENIKVLPIPPRR